VYSKPQPLPRGRHKLPAEHVRASQRERILQAMLHVVAADGYTAATVSKVAATARVSPNSFYELFDDKADCFLALVDREAGVLLEHIVAAGDAPTWLDAVRASARIYLEWWRDRPETTRAYTVELATAGERAIEQRHRTFERFGELFLASAARARAERPDLPPVSPLAVRVVVAGLTEVVSEEVRAGRLDRLPELEDELVALLVQVLTGR
jgi:AcrR family transcriptional regulator